MPEFFQIIAMMAVVSLGAVGIDHVATSTRPGREIARLHEVIKGSDHRAMDAHLERLRQTKHPQRGLLAFAF